MRFSSRRNERLCQCLLVLTFFSILLLYVTKALGLIMPQLQFYGNGNHYIIRFLIFLTSLIFFSEINITDQVILRTIIATICRALPGLGSVPSASHIGRPSVAGRSLSVGRGTGI